MLERSKSAITRAVQIRQNNTVIGWRGLGDACEYGCLWNGLFVYICVLFQHDARLDRARTV